MHRRTGILLVVVLMAITAGCLDMESQVSVNQDGELEQMEFDIVFHDATWGTLESFAQYEGYDSVEEYLKAEDDNVSSQDGGNASEEAYGCDSEDEELTVDEEEQTMSYSCSNPTITNESQLSVEVSDDGDTVTYRDKTMVGEFEGSSGGAGNFTLGEQPEVTHTVVMPGEITDSNAHEVDGQRATWNLTKFDGEELYAESGTEKGLPASGDEGGPGFTIVAGLVAVLALAVIGHRRR